MIPVIPLVCSKLVFGLREMFDRFKDKPVLITVLSIATRWRSHHDWLMIISLPMAIMADFIRGS